MEVCFTSHNPLKTPPRDQSYDAAKLQLLRAYQSLEPQAEAEAKIRRAGEQFYKRTTWKCKIHRVQLLQKIKLQKPEGM